VHQVTAVVLVPGHPRDAARHVPLAVAHIPAKNCLIVFEKANGPRDLFVLGPVEHRDTWIEAEGWSEYEARWPPRLVKRRGRLAPMLATSVQPFDDPAYLFDLKWDGVRAIAAFFTR